eukprot:3819236-Rhodomonas_salina.10
MENRIQRARDAARRGRKGCMHRPELLRLSGENRRKLVCHQEQVRDPSSRPALERGELLAPEPRRQTEQHRALLFNALGPQDPLEEARHRRIDPAGPIRGVRTGLMHRACFRTLTTRCGLRGCRRAP